MKKLLSLVLIFQFLLPVHPAYGEQSTESVKPKRKRNYFFPQLGTFFIPGLDQFINKQPGTGAAFASLGVAGLGLNLAASKSIGKGSTAIDSEDDNVRLAMLGYEMYSVAGGLSMYHSFRDAVDTRPEDFPFLKARDSDWDIVLSPFRLDYMIRPTTFLPLLVQAGLIGYLIRDGGYSWQGMNLKDGFFATSFSVGAGTWEECAFRGWMMPVFRKWIPNNFWSNALTASIFAAAHYSEANKLPIHQLLAGWYLGFVTQHNDWSISESIFIHTWIDIIAFSAAYAFSKDHVARIQLTPIVVRF